MTDESDASAGLQQLTVIRRRRRRAGAVFAAVAAGFFLWPMALQHELPPLRLDTLQVLPNGGDGQGGDAGGRHHDGGHQVHIQRPALRPLATATAHEPVGGFAAAGELPPPLIAALQNLPPVDQPISADLPGFSTPASVSSPGGFTLQTGPGPVDDFPVIGPGAPTSPGNPPVIAPRPGPPVVTPPDLPPPVTRPGNPPPVIPPVIVPVNPPVNPGPPPVLPIDPIPPDPGGPGGGTTGGHPPPPGVPEPSVWIELVLGAGLAGASLRHTRRGGFQPATALRARSKAWAVTTRLGWVFGMRFQASSAATL